MAYDGDGEIKIANHTIYDSKLLKVFLSENGKIGLEDVKKLQNNGENTIEMAWAGRSAKVFGEEVFVNEN